MGLDDENAKVTLVVKNGAMDLLISKTGLPLLKFKELLIIVLKSLNLMIALNILSPAQLKSIIVFIKKVKIDYLCNTLSSNKLSQLVNCINIEKSKFLAKRLLIPGIIF